ncbi:hypothetical protein TW95_gp1446 [Pandoravirus inopinatum]|uniref:Uncharacterized protein n=1 Tax=Pandoravirus inopinatum TaxID=1605721 RepID=A0A0B5J8F9_9VIRU|nr:hypothetical protein TW95_gp1446 [Pandoravirus inopinatum]AJF98180.1 hypothetical protein [Pandoravirus inopinatum]
MRRFLFLKKKDTAWTPKTTASEGVRPVTRSVSHGRLRPAGRDHFLLWLVIARELRGHCTCPNSKKNGYKKHFHFFFSFLQKKDPTIYKKEEGVGVAFCRLFCLLRRWMRPVFAERARTGERLSKYKKIKICRAVLASGIGLPLLDKGPHRTWAR